MTERSLRAFRWLLPGLGVKRWLLLAAFGAVLVLDGAGRWLTAEGAKFGVNEAIDNIVGDIFPDQVLGWLAYIFIAIGLVLTLVGIRQWLRSIVGAIAPLGGESGENIVDALMQRRLQRGYKIVAIGGGTGLGTLLRGLKRYTSNLTAVVTVSDDGGSSGRLQKELGVLPPGDVRNCLVALADDEALVTDLFRYRFEEGEGLTGHSFGNLFLAAMTGITGNFDAAVKESSRVLNIKGRVLPATLAVARLCAELADGTILEGESNVSKATQPIKRVFLDPPMAQPLPEVIAAIRDADAIILGPGSLYTSILPNLLVNSMAAEVAAASAVKIYVCNVMTQPGETDDFSAYAHVKALLESTGEKRLFDYAIVNREPPKKLLEAYAEEGQVMVKPDTGQIEALGVRSITARVISETQTVRHDPKKLAEVTIGVIDKAVAERSSYVKALRPAPTSAPDALLH